MPSICSKYIAFLASARVSSVTLAIPPAEVVERVEGSWEVDEGEARRRARRGGDEREVAMCEGLLLRPRADIPSTDHHIEPHDIEGLDLWSMAVKARAEGFYVSAADGWCMCLRWRRGWIIDLDLNGGVGAVWWTSGGVPQHGLTFNLIDEMELAYA